uniref:ABC transporter domain-containing protein n=1 Tax=Timema bartmani TaxID=61472 RepID=A0A7R9F7Z2_9NEOP|nr:unnamed protein product [Timema bartmani]
MSGTRTNMSRTRNNMSGKGVNGRRGRGGGGKVAGGEGEANSQSEMSGVAKSGSLLAIMGGRNLFQATYCNGGGRPESRGTFTRHRVNLESKNRTEKPREVESPVHCRVTTTYAMLTHAWSWSCALAVAPRVPIHSTTTCNGAGKTTLLATISRRIKGNTTGEVLINGRSIDPAFMANMSGFVPQQDLVVDSLTVREHMEFMNGLSTFVIAPPQAAAFLKFKFLYRVSNSVVNASKHKQTPRRANPYRILIRGVDRESYDVPTADIHTGLVYETLKWAGQDFPRLEEDCLPAL